MGTVPIGTGEFRIIHSLVSWMFLPVERSITVSAPQRMAQIIFSTSSSIVEVTAEFPILALILTRKFLPIIMGSDSGWLMLAGIMARPLATSSLTNSGVIIRGRKAPKLSPGWILVVSFRFSSFWFSRIAIYSISGVMIPFFA